MLHINPYWPLATKFVMPQRFCLNFFLVYLPFAYILKFFWQVNVSISSRDKYCIEVVLRCLSVVGDGVWPHELNDGGILATVMAAGFKGETL